MLAPSIPRSAISSRAASMTLRCASLLGVLATSELDPREQPAPGEEEDHAEYRQYGKIQRDAEVSGSDQRTAQPVHPVGERIDGGHNVESLREIVQREQRARKEED